MKNIRFTLSIKLILFFIISLIFVPITFIYTEYFNNLIEKNIFKEKENRILTVLTLSSKIFSDDDFEQHIRKKNYNYLKARLEELKLELPNVKETFILYREKNKIFNLLDKDYDITKISDIYLRHGFIKPTISKIIYSDKSSKWFLAFSPIKEIDNKEFILLMEIFVNNYENTYFSKIFQDITILSIILVFLILYAILALILKPLKNLNIIINNIGNGKFDFNKNIYWFYSEISILFYSLIKISKNIENYIEKNQNIEKKLEENNKMIENSNKQNKNKISQLNHLITVLNKINLLTEKLISIKDFNIFTASIMEGLIDIFDIEKALLIKYISEENKFKILDLLNTNNIDINSNEYILDKNNIIMTSIETKNTTIIDEKSIIFEEKFNNAIISPIIINNSIKAFIIIMNKKNSDFNEEDESTIKTFSKLVASLLERY